MAGYFRQLADRVLDPVPGLRPLAIAMGAQTREPDVEDVLSSIRNIADPSGIAIRDVADPAPDRASRDASAVPLAPATDSIAGRPGDESRLGEDTHRTVMLPQPRDEAPTPPALHGFLPPSPENTRKRAPLIARDEAPARVESTVPHRPPSVKHAPSPRRALPDALRPTSIRTNPQHDRRTQVADAQAAPEVHIHIGRIELTAVAPSRPARRESAATRKPMSLDEYLQHRNRKTP